MAKASAGGFNLMQFDAGGLASEIVGQITRARWAFFDYKGQAQQVTALIIDVAEEDDNGSPTGHVYEEQVYSAGSDKFSVPDSEDVDDRGDAMTLRKVGNRDTLVRDSQIALFCSALMNCGMTADNPFLSDADCRGLAGSRIHLVRKAAPKREGLKDQKEDKQWLQPTRWAPKGQLLPGPGGKPGGAAPAPAQPQARPAAAGSPAAAPAPSAPSGYKLSDEDSTRLMAFLMEAAPFGSGVKPLNMLRATVMQAMGKAGVPTKDRNALMAGITPEWLTSCGYTVDGNNVTAPA